jgi:hypothetical protein
MSYDGPMLGTSVVQTLMSLPTAIREVRDIHSSRKPSASRAATLADMIRVAILSLGDVSGWLEEAKRVHQSLQYLDTAMAPAHALYIQAISDGAFNPRRYDMGSARATWRVAKVEYLAPVLAAARTLRRIERVPLLLHPDGTFDAGPDWAMRFLNISTHIDLSFNEYDKGDYRAISATADLLSEFGEFVKIQVHFIDQRVREEASSFGVAIARLCGALENDAPR